MLILYPSGKFLRKGKRRNTQRSQDFLVLIDYSCNWKHAKQTWEMVCQVLDYLILEANKLWNAISKVHVSTRCMNILLQVLMGSSMKTTFILPLLLHSQNGFPEFADSPIWTMKNKKKLLRILQAHSQAHQSHLLGCPAHNSTHRQLLLIPDPHKRIHHMIPRLPHLQ